MVTHKERALKAVHEVLKPGGRMLILEFSKPRDEFLGRLYDAYSFGVLPRLGKLVTGDEDSYRYLVESIRMHPDQDTLLEMMEDAGFERCDYHDMSGWDRRSPSRLSPNMTNLYPEYSCPGGARIRDRASLGDGPTQRPETCHTRRTGTSLAL